MKDNEKISNARHATYSDAQSVYLEKLASEGVSKQQIKNTRFVVPSWCNSLGLEMSNEIGDELNQSFTKNVSKYITKQIESKIKKSTYSSRVSIIKKFRRFYLNYKETNFLPESFGGRLKFFLEKSEVSAAKFVKIHLDGQVDYNSFLCWVQGKAIPKKSSLRIVELIEEKLTLSPGTLTLTLPYRKIHSPNNNKTVEFRKRMQIIVNKPHRVLTELLKQEFDEFTEYKLTPNLPENMERLSAWTRNENGEIPSAVLCLRYVTDFSGFLCLSPNNPDLKFRGRGFNKNQMTLALLTDKRLVERVRNCIQEESFRQ